MYRLNLIAPCVPKGKEKGHLAMTVSMGFFIIQLTKYTIAFVCTANGLERKEVYLELLKGLNFYRKCSLMVSDRLHT